MEDLTLDRFQEIADQTNMRGLIARNAILFRPEATAALRWRLEGFRRQGPVGREVDRLDSTGYLNRG